MWTAEALDGEFVVLGEWPRYMIDRQEDEGVYVQEKGATG